MGSPLLYRYQLIGELKFIDEKGNFIDLPPKAVKYVVNRNCYLLFDNDFNMALMRFDGTVLTDFSYKSLDGEDGIVCPAMGQYVKVWKTANGKYKCGVIDLESGKELLPCEYDTIVLYSRAIHAIKDEKTFLFDYKANLIRDFNERVHFDSSFSYFYENKYYLDNESGKIIANGDIMIDQYYKTYNILISDAENKITITDKQWNPIYTLPERDSAKFRAKTHEYVVFGFSEEIVVISQGKDIIKFPFSLEVLGIENYESFYELYEKIEYKDNKLIFYIKISPTDGEFFNCFTLDQTGKIIQTEYNVRYTTVDEDNIAYQYFNRFALLDDEGNELIPYSPYALFKGGSFIFAELEDNRTDTYKAKIYNTRGKLLLDNVFGIPSYLTLPNGATVVYTTDSKCYLLFPDGKLTPIANASKVRREYLDG